MLSLGNVDPSVVAAVVAGACGLVAVSGLVRLFSVPPAAGQRQPAAPLPAAALAPSRPSPAEARSATRPTADDHRRKRVMSAVEIAIRFVKHMRDEGFIGLEAAMLPDDLDREMFEFCGRLDLELIPPHIMREAIAALPGVQRRRGRIKSEPALRQRARRAEALGRVGEKPTFYVIYADPAASDKPRASRQMQAETRRRQPPAAAGGEIVVGYARAA